MSRPSQMTIALGFAAIYIIWGSTYLAIRFGLETMPPFLMVGVRFIIGGGLFYLAVIKGNPQRATRSQWFHSAIIGLLLVVGGNGFVTWAEVTVPSGLTALIVAVVPMWIVLMDWLRPGGVRPRLVVILGVVLGFGGVGFLINPTGLGSQPEIDTFGALLVVIATLLWSFGSIYSRQADQPESKPLGVAMQMIIGGVALVLISLLSGELATFEIDAVSSRSALALVYLITFGSLGFFAYVWLLKWSTPAKVATYAYVNPVIALLLGNLLASEPISIRTIACSFVILTAVVIIVAAKSRGERAKTESCPEIPQSSFASTVE